VCRRVRGGLHAEHQQRPGGHQVDRARDHRQGWAEGWWCRSRRRAGPAGSGGRRQRPPPGRRAAAGPCRPRRDGVREERPRRRPAALWHSDFRWRSRTSIAASSRCRPRASPSAPACGSASRRRQDQRLQQGVGRRRATDGQFDAVVLAGGAEVRATCRCRPRVRGVHFAMEFLRSRTRSSPATRSRGNSRTGKHVVVIAAATPARLRRTSNRHGAKSVAQFELLPQPPAQENKELTGRTGR